MAGALQASMLDHGCGMLAAASGNPTLPDWLGGPAFDLFFRACQRFALTATSLGIKHAYVNQPVEVADLRPQLAALAGVDDRRPNIVLRIGYGPEMPFSPRRPVHQMLT